MATVPKYFLVVPINDGNGYEPEDLEPIQASTAPKAIEAFRDIHGHTYDCDYDVRELAAPVRYNGKSVSKTVITKVKS